MLSQIVSDLGANLGVSDTNPQRRALRNRPIVHPIADLGIFSYFISIAITVTRDTWHAHLGIRLVLTHAKALCGPFREVRLQAAASIGVNQGPAGA
jgi:hypothetical protein